MFYSDRENKMVLQGVFIKLLQLIATLINIGQKALHR